MRSGRTGTNQTVDVRINDQIELEVFGYYIPWEDESEFNPGSGSRFEIESVRITKGTVWDVIAETVDPDDLEDKCIDIIERD
jgi:predicted P-loop ATPase/GTPase